jgi:hypothetical protein
VSHARVARALTVPFVRQPTCPLIPSVATSYPSLDTCHPRASHVLRLVIGARRRRSPRASCGWRCASW